MMYKILAVSLMVLLSSCGLFKAETPPVEEKSAMQVKKATPVPAVTPVLRGFNVLQHKGAAWNTPQAMASLRELSDLGARSVIFIPFLTQENSSALSLKVSNAVTDRQLFDGIANAKSLGFHVVLKPQIMISNAWAGEIKQPTVERWNLWFSSYSEHLLAYAKFAEFAGVDALVIGTELKHASDYVNWPQLIRDIRAVYSGKLTYAAHNVEGVQRFPFWSLLDIVSVTLYPSLGIFGHKDDMELYIQKEIFKLDRVRKQIGMPLWVMEIGMASYEGAYEKPWEWPDRKRGLKVDMQVQEDALSIWIDALEQPWVDGYFIWAWFSNPDAGGSKDVDYTPQNKPAARMIKQRWSMEGHNE